MIRVLGRYELLEQVGSGGMAIVYRGRDTALDREVAVKLLHPHLASAPESRARFSREARAVARLSHPAIVEIYDYAGDDAVESFLVTEFVRGRTLRAFAQEVGFGHPELAMLVGRALADALVHAHSAGVIHRDLKPENVLVADGARPAVKLADFGIARILASDERMTMTGALVGSPHHMAPEIVEGGEADARSDIFSLGTILYWLATGKLPFAAPSPTAILRRVLQGDFEDPRSADPLVPDPLADLVGRCLALDPAERPATAGEVRDALDRILDEVGLPHADEALIAFLRDPLAATAAFPARAVAALTARGDAALADGNAARALAFYNRVLAIDPEDRHVPAKLARLSRRRRRRRVVRAGAALALATALVAGGTAIVRGRRPSVESTAARTPPPAAASPLAGPAQAADVTWAAPPSAATPGQHPDGDPIAAAGASAASARGGEGGASPSGEPRAPTRTAPASTRAAAGPAAQLSVYVRPYAQRALLDGVEVASGEQHVTFAIAPGRPHVIQIEHACCTTFVKEITAAEAERVGELRVPLEAKPARLRVEGDPATRVFVDGRFVGTAGESQRSPFPVPVPAGRDSPYEGRAQIGLEGDAAAPRTVQVKLRAGGEVVVAAPQPEVAP